MITIHTCRYKESRIEIPFIFIFPGSFSFTKAEGFHWLSIIKKCEKDWLMSIIFLVNSKLSLYLSTSIFKVDLILYYPLDWPDTTTDERKSKACKRNYTRVSVTLLIAYQLVIKQKSLDWYFFSYLFCYRLSIGAACGLSWPSERLIV